MRALLARVAEMREGMAGLHRECGGDAALQEQMAGLYIDIEDARKALESAKQVAQAPVGLFDWFSRLLESAPRQYPDTPQVVAARAALTQREAELDGVNAFFRKLRGLRDELAQRVELLGESAGRLAGYNGGALKARLLGLADRAAFAAFAAEMHGGVYVELLLHAGRHVEVLKQTGMQIDTAVRMIESASETARIQAPSSMFGVARAVAATKDIGQAGLRDVLGRLQSRMFPDLIAAVGKAESGLARLGVRVPAPTAPVAPTEGVPVGMAEADGHRLRYELLGFSKAVQAYRTAVEAELKAVQEKRAALEPEGGAGAGARAAGSTAVAAHDGAVATHDGAVAAHAGAIAEHARAVAAHSSAVAASDGAVAEPGPDATAGASAAPGTEGTKGGDAGSAASAGAPLDPAPAAPLEPAPAGPQAIPATPGMDVLLPPPSEGDGKPA